MKLVAPDGKIVLQKYTPKTQSGLDVPSGQKGESRIGKVHSFGKPLKDQPIINLKKDQLVVFKKYVSNDLYIPELNDTFDFVEYDDIVAVLQEGKSE